MDFHTLNEILPYVCGGKEHLLTYKPYSNVTLKFPGKHAKDTDPKGGDFVVCVDEPQMGWVEHQFTHNDIFSDVQSKVDIVRANWSQDLTTPQLLLKDYLHVIRGRDTGQVWSQNRLPGMHPHTFLCAVQCLAVAEHRRYGHFESKFGGRYLPFRFASGIVEGNWTAADAAAKERMGRPGVEWLEKEFGIPQLTKELMHG